MSSKLIKGKDVMVYSVVGLDEAPIICAKSCTIRRTFEKIEKTSWASTAREYTTGMYDWSITLEGIVTIEQMGVFDVTALDLFAQGGTLELRVVFTAESGAENSLQGGVIVPDMSITADVSDFANFSVTFDGTGPFTIS